jgi:hypothetical protein
MLVHSQRLSSQYIPPCCQECVLLTQYSGGDWVTACAIESSHMLCDVSTAGLLNGKPPCTKAQSNVLLVPCIHPHSHQIAVCLSHSMELNLQSAADVSERRRLQNRDAQRRFRRKSHLFRVERYNGNLTTSCREERTTTSSGTQHQLPT